MFNDVYEMYVYINDNMIDDLQMAAGQDYFVESYCYNEAV